MVVESERDIPGAFRSEVSGGGGDFYENDLFAVA